jgi:uncharacterized membrane protein YesL
MSDVIILPLPHESLYEKAKRKARDWKKNFKKPDPIIIIFAAIGIFNGVKLALIQRQFLNIEDIIDRIPVYILWIGFIIATSYIFPIVKFRHILFVAIVQVLSYSVVSASLGTFDYLMIFDQSIIYLIAGAFINAIEHNQEKRK